MRNSFQSDPPIRSYPSPSLVWLCAPPAERVCVGCYGHFRPDKLASEDKTLVRQACTISKIHSIGHFPPSDADFQRVQLPASGLPPPLCPTLVPQCSKVNYTSIPLVLEVLERFPPSGLWSGSTRARAEAGRVRTGCRTSRTGQTHARYNQSQSRFTNVFFTHNHIHPCASSNACKSCIGHSRLSGCS
jgi:hypothetical protein